MRLAYFIALLMTLAASLVPNSFSAELCESLGISVRKILTEPRVVRWLAHPHQDHEVNNLFLRLMNMGLEEREKAVHEAIFEGNLGSLEKSVLTLTLYREEDWIRFLQKADSDLIYAAKHMLDGLLPLIARMPENLADRLSKHGVVRYTDKSLKRVLDAFWRVRFPAEVEIPKLVESGKSPLEAYNAYLGRSRRMFREAGLGEQYGNYDASEVLRVAEKIQEWMQWADTQSIERPRSLTIFGSFPTGRANFTRSDIDLTTGLGYGAWDQNPQRFSGQLSKYVNASLHVSHPAANMDISIVNVAYDFAAANSPVQIRVTKDSIELLVFPQPHHGSTVKFPDPLRYPL